MNSKSKVSIVTGAGTGVGRCTTLTLLRDGYSVVLAGRRKDPLEATINESGKTDSQTLIVPTDVSDPDSVKELFKQTKEKFGRLDLLFNNAGIAAPPLPLEDIDYKQWKAIVDVNLTGSFLCTQAAFNIMKSQKPIGGRIINNGSISAHTPRPFSSPYTATKHAITGLTRSTSLDGRRYDIACGQIDIGNADTEMTAPMEEGIIQANGKISVEPRMDSSNVANAVVYMASLPLDTNVLFMTIMASKMPFVGRG